MIPINATEALKGRVFSRLDSDEVSQVFKMHGISRPGSFVEFYKLYRGPFTSRKSGFELLDIIDQSPNILELSQTVHEDFDLPKNFLVITDLLANGFLVLDCNIDQVFNVDLEGGIEMLKSGTLEKMKPSFESFLDWYFMA